MRDHPGEQADPAATLGFLQDELEAIYGVTAPRVADFLLGLEAARAMGQVPRAPEALRGPVTLP